MDVLIKTGLYGYVFFDLVISKKYEVSYLKGTRPETEIGDLYQYLLCTDDSLGTTET